MSASEVLIGIVTTVRPKTVEKNRISVRRPPIYFRKIAEYAREQMARVILFAPEDVHWEQRFVSAWAADKSSQPNRNWSKVRSPLPNVIYENVFVHLAVTGFSSTLRQRAKNLGIPVFNPPMPDKWKMHQVMQRGELRKYAPQTERLSDAAHAVKTIERWGTTYLKPVGGYGGVGVTRIQPKHNHRYRVSVDRTARNSEKTRVELSRDGLIQMLRKRRHVPHLLQQGLHLMTVRGRKLDFRVVLQRGGDGKWHLIGIIPKQAQQDGVVTNIIAGGERWSLEQCDGLARLEGKSIPKDKLEHCAIQIAQRLSQRNPLIGLVGFDLGVDTSGEVFMIEMNPKPARSLLTAEMKKRLAKHMVAFAIYLANRR